MTDELPPIVVNCTGGESRDGRKVIYLEVPDWVEIEVGSLWSLVPYVPDSADGGRG